jgi:hypothetical protein
MINQQIMYFASENLTRITVVFLIFVHFSDVVQCAGGADSADGAGGGTPMPRETTEIDLTFVRSSLHLIPGKGFHRMMSLDIVPNLELEFGESCVMKAKLAVPVDVYFDVHQISMQYNSSQFTMVSSDGLSTELPSDLVKRSHFVIYSRTEEPQFHKELPIHFRYQPPCEDGYQTVTALPLVEEVFLHCPNWRWDGLWQNSLLEETCWDGDSGELAGVHCLWLRLQTVGTSKGENVPSPVNVPCGTQHHALPVAALTALVTAACSIYIFRHLSKQISNIHRINEQKIQ